MHIERDFMINGLEAKYQSQETRTKGCKEMVVEILKEGNNYCGQYFLVERELGSS